MNYAPPPLSGGINLVNLQQDFAVSVPRPDTPTPGPQQQSSARIIQTDRQKEGIVLTVGSRVCSKASSP